MSTLPHVPSRSAQGKSYFILHITLTEYTHTYSSWLWIQTHPRKLIIISQTTRRNFRSAFSVNELLGHIHKCIRPVHYKRSHTSQTHHGASFRNTDDTMTKTLKLTPWRDQNEHRRVQLPIENFVPKSYARIPRFISLSVHCINLKTVTKQYHKRQSKTAILKLKFNFY